MKLLCALAVCALMCGTASADSIAMPSNWTCAGYDASTCGFAADAVAPWPLTSVDPLNTPADYWAAAAMFYIDQDTGELVIILANISERLMENPNYLLTAVLFDIGNADGVDDANDVILTAVSATLAGGATILNAGTCDLTGKADGDNAAECTGQTDVGAEWAYNQLDSPYANHFPGLPGPTYGISSSGLSYFGPTDLFPNGTGDLDKPDSPNGVNFGITPIVGVADSPDQSEDASENLDKNPLIKSGATNGAVVFRFTFDGDLDISRINNVLFQYGTDTAEPFTWPNCVVPDASGAINGPDGANPDECGGTNEVPEPASLILVGSGFLGLAGFLRRKLS